MSNKMYEDKLLTVFETVNIKLGKVSPHVIKAWFDTDCEELLKWICDSITEECYVSAQEESECSQIDMLANEQLNKQVKVIERKYPGLFDAQSNLFDVEIAKDTIEMLEEHLQDCNHKIQANQQLHQMLLGEVSKVTAEEIRYRLEEESALERCTTLTNELDSINADTYDQIIKYSFYLSNYEFAEFPVFTNNVDITDFEEKFLDAANSLKSITKIDRDLLEISDGKYATDALSEFESRLFHSRISQLVLQMEIDALNFTLKFLETYDTTNSCLVFMNLDSVQLSINVGKDQQSCMLKGIEELALKQAGHCVNQPTLRCLKNEFDFFQLKLNYLNKFSGDLVKILQLFGVMHTLYLQETLDIKNSSQFFRNVHKYINKDLKLSKFRKEAMLKLISQYEDFCLLPIEKRFKLVGDFANVTLKGTSGGLRKILEKTATLRRDAGKIRKHFWRSTGTDVPAITQLRNSIHVLRDFLNCGPTSQMVVVPVPLQSLLFEVDKSILDQSRCVKLFIQAAQEPKDIFAKDKWLRHQDQLWTYFMTDGTRMLSFLEQIKYSERRPEEKNHQNATILL